MLRTRSPAVFGGYAGAKLRGAAASLLAVAFTGFFIFRVLPGDPVRTITRGRPVSAAQLAALRHTFGLDKPLVVQFGDYLLRLAHGDLGVSYQYRTPVFRLVLDHLAATVYLVGSATLVAAVLGLWLGARSAWRRGSTSDRVHTAIALTLWSVPSFWLGLILIVVLAVGVGPVPGVFPTGGISGVGVSGLLPVLADRLGHLALPCLTLVAILYAQYLLIMRSSLLDEMGEDYLTTARAKGLRDAEIRRRHAVPNALLPAVTLVFLQLGTAVSGAVLVEAIFSWPGLGSLFYQAVGVPDLPLLQGLFLVFSASVIVMNLLAELAYPLLDPRVRAG
ncbi:MAG TPA: ABC transporter permease [Actinomycetota bacterium]|nr:ABC transporter permease [Actinomycetota bacterium]